MSIYAGNMAALKQHDPELASHIEAIDTSWAPTDTSWAPTDTSWALTDTTTDNDCELFRARSGAVTGRINGRYICSRYDPQKESKKLLEKLPLKRASIIAFWGMGLGHLPAEFFREYWDKISPVLIVEQCPSLVRVALNEHDFSRPLEAGLLTIIVGKTSFTELFNYLILEQRYVLAAAAGVHVDHPILTSLFSDYYQQVKYEYLRVVEHMVRSMGNDPNDGLIGLKNFLTNIPVVLENPGLNQVFGQFKGDPAVVVSAGPSLSKNCHMLPDIAERAVILCCDAVLKAQLKKKFKPHMAFALERSPETVEFFSCIPTEKTKDTFAVSTSISDPSLYEQYSGSHVIVYRPEHKFGCLPVEKGTISAGHSVAHMAFHSAVAMGCDPIILIGQDLAYGPGEETHWAGADFAAANQLQWEAETGVKRYPVPGNFSETVLTNVIWDTFRNQFEIDIAAYQGRVINATEGGARIAGTTVMSLEEASGRYMTRNIDVLPRLKKLLIPPAEEDISALHQEMLQRLKQLADYINEIKTVLSEGARRAGSFAADVRQMPVTAQVNLANPIFSLAKHFADEDRKRDFFIMNMVGMLQLKNQIDMLRLYHEIEDLAQYLAVAVAVCGEYYSNIVHLADMLHSEVMCTIERLEKMWS